MNTWEKIFYGFCIGILYSRLDVQLLWSHTPKLVGLALVFVPLMLLYLHYSKYKKGSIYSSKMLGIYPDYIMDLTMAGYYFGMDAAMLVHEHLGWMLFILLIFPHPVSQLLYDICI